MPHEIRWSDEKLERFYQEFHDHLKTEADEKAQQNELHAAIFQKEDSDYNTPAGVLQLVTRMDARLKTMEVTADRQKRFIGGIVFTFTCLGFLFTDAAHRVMAFFKTV
jgi:hypothetical protein